MGEPYVVGRRGDAVDRDGRGGGSRVTGAVVTRTERVVRCLAVVPRWCPRPLGRPSAGDRYGRSRVDG